MSSNKIENVLVLQGGGSLGAFACGVFKALANKNIKIDIVAGTSIGGINAAIIAGSVDKEHPERTLEEFWLELGENSVNLTNPVVEWLYDKSRGRLLRAADNLLPTTDKLNSLLSTTRLYTLWQRQVLRSISNRSLVVQKQNYKYVFKVIM